MYKQMYKPLSPDNVLASIKILQISPDGSGVNGQIRRREEQYLREVAQTFRDFANNVNCFIGHEHPVSRYLLEYAEKIMVVVYIAEYEDSGIKRREENADDFV